MLIKVTRYFDEKGTPDAEKKTEVVRALRGSALTWYMSGGGAN